ncbi:sulfotransferase family 2 domain-containing protein [Nocardioides sp. zg-1228]|uniref:sulfotransferase family 2 domain-containing protein n=1 Tax=Nocardioides sp. zg-1228 TaxID=2763008 RepID=UPI001642444F|nr:sulfotransferase family 2 domain-containing protein [Nocardioides sp. zg-1228]MBC2931530.1 sulfotransferase family 2 domain-containing protein [Nocardioides sp. zg-1228]QSF57133.1 sulfotransferase family 2 domain-containing protein [Nocardioides sp. zg-1228]
MSSSGPHPPPPGLFRTRAGNRRRLTPEAQEEVERLAGAAEASAWLSPLAYNLTISHSHRFVWYRVAKVATRTIRHHCETHGVSMDVDHAMRVRYPLASFADYFTFAFVRDPLDRFVSAWQDKVVDHNYYGFDPATLARMQAIEEFARWTAGHDLAAVPGTDQHLTLQSRMIDLNRVDFVGRLETFDRDFAEVCERIGAPAVPTAPKNQTAPGGRDRRVSPELGELVGRMYARDYQVFGYEPPA